MSILIKGIPLGGYEISIMKDGERYRARVDGIWCEVEEISTTEPDTDTISRHAAISAICNACGKIDCDKMDKCEKLQLPPANCSEFTNNSDTISRQAAIDFINAGHLCNPNEPRWSDNEVVNFLKSRPPAQPEQLGTNLAEVGTDCISRQAAIDALRAMQTYKLFAGDDMLLIDQAGAQTELMMLPPAQPEPHWIPVTEATPTEDDDYWATFEAETGRFVDWASWYQGRWVVWIDGSPAPLSNVIAWCKPMEPYKGVTK